MYPFARLPLHMFLAARMAPLPLTGVHECTLRCWPWDIDPWMELNNGRTLTLYDLGRTAMAVRIGLIAALKYNGWGITVAGNSVRYRHRVQAFQKLTMRSRVTCWDERFVYMEQSMWNAKGACTSHQLVRGAVVDKDGMVPTKKVAAALGETGPSPAMPDWIAAWSAAEAQRPWPPMMDQI